MPNMPDSMITNHMTKEFEQSGWMVNELTVFSVF